MNLTVKQKIKLLTLLSWITCLSTVYYLISTTLKATTVQGLSEAAVSGGEAILGVKMGIVTIAGLIAIVKIMDMKFNLVDEL